MVLLVAPVAASAHHSRAEFSGPDEVFEITGELVDVVWRNPHPRFTLLTQNVSGGEELWLLEAYGNALTLQRTGVMSDHFEPGAIVSVAGRTSTRRDNVLLATHMLLADGTEAILEYHAGPYWSDRHIGGEDTWAIDPEVLARAAEEGREIFRVWSIPRRGLDVEYFPFTEAALAARERFDPLDSYLTRCEQPGMPMTMMRPHRYEFIDRDDVIELHGQYFDTVRIIHMSDITELDAQPATRLGVSVGRWDEGTLVVETTGIDWPYLDPLGTPQSDAIEVVERFTLSDDQSRLDYHMTITDPTTFTEPATYEKYWLALGEAVLPYDCLLD